MIHTCPPPPPSRPLLITPQELLKSASHDINSRAFLGKPLSGKLWRKEVAQERSSHTGGRISFLHLPRGLCECVCFCEHVCSWVYADYHVIVCNYVLGGGTLSSHCESPSASKWALYKAGQGKGLYTGSAHSFVNCSVIADKKQQLSSLSNQDLEGIYRSANTETDIYKRHGTPLMWCNKGVWKHIRGCLICLILFEGVWFLS